MANNDIENLIPGFNRLSVEKQNQFMADIQYIIKSFKTPMPTQSFFVNSTYASRTIGRQEAEEKTQRLRGLLHSHSAFAPLKKEILILNMQDIDIHWDIMSDTEKDWILNLSYTQLPLPRDWLQSFFNDHHPDTLAIHQKLIQHYQASFGFLFRTDSLKFLFDVEQQIKKLNAEETQAYLINLLNQDWGYSHFNIMDSIALVKNYLQDWFKLTLYPLKKYMDEMLSAHIFYRFFGISSDHVILGSSLENPGLPYVNVFDYYNYHINRKSIHAAMSVWQALFKPLRPFFHEYVELAQAEKNLIMICIRAFMPFFIMSMVLALGYAAILPLAYHQLIEYIFFIPAFYFSIVIASQYIQLKNYLFLNFVQWYFGSVYATSTFEPSQTLIEGMKSRELAQDIAKYYVSCLEQCDKVERCYQKSSQSLNNQQIINRKQNAQLKSILLDEWNDFRTSAIDPEQVSKIVQYRLLTDKENTQKTIIQLYKIYFNLPEDQKSSFKHKYTYLKIKLEHIHTLEIKLANIIDKQDCLGHEEQLYFKLSQMI